jgi:adenylate cyclase
VDKFIGDEIMALFGAPVAHEDDPVRALHAVIEMTETLNAFNQEYETDLGLHAGINTGLVVAGGIGSEGRQEYSVMGDTVNVAARLRAESERGEILVGADTYRLTRPIFEFDRLEPVKVKGKIEPVSAFRLADVKSKPDSVRGLAGLESEMIGRESEFGTLARMTEAVKAGLGRGVLILGEPGLGKSRLITEWLSELDQDSSASEDTSAVRWAIGHCLSYGHGQAYHLLLDLLRSLIDVPTTLDEREKSTILKSFTEDLLGSSSDEVYPYLGHLLSIPLDGESREKVLSLAPSDLQALYIVSIRRLLLAIAEREPLILICEDIHWADPSSIEILLKLLPVINESRIILCFTARPEREIPG